MNTATIAAAEIRPADFLISTGLLNPPERVPYLQAEIAAFCELSKILVDDPRVALRQFLEITLRLCRAGTAGLSLLRPGADGQATVHWEAVSGALAAHEGADTPRDFSPCGLCLDAGTTILVSRPERVFTYLRNTRPAIVEDLIVPLYDNAKKPLGTFWMAHHDSTSHFCSDDARMLEQLAVQLVLALKLMEQAREHRHALALLESHQAALRNLLAYDLAKERSQRERAEESERAVRQTLAFKDAVIHEAHHRVKNTLQIAASLLSLHARAAPTQARLVLQESHERLHLLAKVHELLYTSADAQEILMPKLLEEMGDALRQSFAETSARVSLRVASDPIMLCADDAIPIALLANEAITNAYKHAFADGGGEITVDLRCAPESALILQVADNGIGMRTSGSESGLGLKLIHTFAAQLQGTLAFTQPADAAGTQVTLRFQRGARRSSIAAA